MRIAIVNLTGGGFSGGYRKYLLNLAPVLQRDPRVSEAVYFVHESLQHTPGLETVKLQTWPARDHWFGYRRLKAAIRAFGPDVVFIPSARWLSLGGMPTVVMVRNMEPLEVPFGGNPMVERLKNILRAREAKKACTSATRVIAVSNHVRDFLTTRWSVSPNKVGMVYHGIDAAAGELEAERPPSVGELVPGEFIFTAGSIRPARGLEDLVGAIGILAKTGQVRPAVIAGGVDAGMGFCKQNLDHMAAKLDVKEHLVWAGKLSPAQMAWCYRHCALFVMTTRAEACPNTALEAMSHGCLSVATDKAPLPEFFERSAVFYHGGDARGLAEGIGRALHCVPEEQQRLRAAAKARASQFRWDDTARLTIAELARAASAKGTGATPI